MRLEREVTESPLRARGNLGYIQFLQLLQKMWSDAHPEVPLVAQGGKEFSDYPVITYRLDLRKPLANEPKFRYREQVITAPGEPNLIIFGQRFQNVVTFTAWTNDDPYLADELIEVFEDFMMEFTPVFKKLGLSEILYARRLPDENGARGKGLGIVERSVSYLVTIEKIKRMEKPKLEQIIIDARKFIADPYWVEQATPATPLITRFVDQFTTDPTSL